MQFSKIIGQDKIIKQLTTSVQHGRIPHAQLFLAKRGAGGLPLALAFAQYANCTNKSESDSCGTCSSCQQMEKLVHPYLYLTFPTIKTSELKNKVPISTHFIESFREFILQNPYASEQDWIANIEEGNKQANITANECVEIIKNTKLKVPDQQYKISIIWMPERLGKEGNRLLKLLEEPPNNTLFLLVAEDEELILNTILSRTQLLRLNSLSDEDIVTYLHEEKNLETSHAQHIALLSNGDLGLATQLAENTDQDQKEHLVLWFQSIFKHKTQMVNQVEQLASLSRERMKNLLYHGIEITREAVFLQGDIFPSRLTKSDEQIARWLGKMLSLEELSQLSTYFENTIVSMERNANAKLQLLNLSIQLEQLIAQREAAQTPASKI